MAALPIMIPVELAEMATSTTMSSGRCNGYWGPGHDELCPTKSLDSYYDNGQLRVRGYQYHGKLKGLWESYYRNGQLKEKRFYNWNLRSASDKHGTWESYYEDGQLKEKVSYKNDMKDGLSESYYENGQLKEKGSYKNVKGSHKNGERVGPWESYYENGQLKEKGSYKNERKSRFRFNWEQIDVVRERGSAYKFTGLNRILGSPPAIGKFDSFEHRRGVPKEYITDLTWLDIFHKGELKGRRYYGDGTEDGFWISYHDNGNLKYKGSYKDEWVDGPWEYYHYNGHLQSKGSYKDRHRDGPWEFYHENGNLKMKGSFKNGKLDGLWETYHMSGDTDFARLKQSFWF